MDVSNASPVLPDASMIMRTSRAHIPCGKVHKKKPGKLEVVRSNGWVDAMIASSPPHCDDEAHADWMIKCPSALKSLERLASVSRTKKIAVFLDYDGTLTPIVDDPDRAIISGAARSAVQEVSERFPTAIISGRSRDKVFDLVRLPGLHYAGSHGMDISMKGEKTSLFQPAAEFIEVVESVFRVLEAKTRSIRGARVENHKFCASVHYRNVDERDWSTVAQIVHDVIEEYPRLRLTHGRRVLEVRPVIEWDKGRAVEFMLESLEIDGGHAFPIYIGDDRTDEDAFAVLKKGNRGCGILVSSVSKETSASYSLKDPSEVLMFLKALAKL